MLTFLLKLYYTENVSKRSIKGVETQDTADQA
jgi:hypothetical protein